MDFFKNLSDFTVFTGLVTLVSAILSFLLSQLSLRDGRRKFLGVTRKAFQTYASYSTLFFAIVTLFVQNRHEFNENEEKRIQKVHTDSARQAEIDTTLKAINATLQVQKITQDSTKILLNRQKTELKNQADLLIGEQKSLDNYVRLLAAQAMISKGIDENSKGIYESNTKQDSNNKVATQTSKSIESLNYPIAFGLALDLRIRIYVEGAKALMKNKVSSDKAIINHNEDIKTFTSQYAGKISVNELKNYWRFFFYALSPTGYDRQMIIESKLTSIKFDDFKGLNLSEGMYVSTADVYFNSEQSFFEFPFRCFSGGIESNSSNLTNFVQLFNKGEIMLKIKYGFQRDIILPMEDNKAASIHVKSVEIVDARKLSYGNGLSNILMVNPIRLIGHDKESTLKNLFKLDIGPGEDWRYDIIKIPLISETIAKP